MSKSEKITHESGEPESAYAQVFLEKYLDQRPTDSAFTNEALIVFQDALVKGKLVLLEEQKTRRDLFISLDDVGACVKVYRFRGKQVEWAIIPNPPDDKELESLLMKSAEDNGVPLTGKYTSFDTALFVDEDLIWKVAQEGMKKQEADYAEFVGDTDRENYIVNFYSGILTYIPSIVDAIERKRGALEQINELSGKMGIDKVSAFIRTGLGGNSDSKDSDTLNTWLNSLEKLKNFFSEGLTDTREYDQDLSRNTLVALIVLGRPINNFSLKNPRISSDDAFAFGELVVNIDAFARGLAKDPLDEQSLEALAQNVRVIYVRKMFDGKKGEIADSLKSLNVPREILFEFIEGVICEAISKFPIEKYLKASASQASREDVTTYNYLFKIRPGITGKTTSTFTSARASNLSEETKKGDFNFEQFLDLRDTDLSLFIEQVIIGKPGEREKVFFTLLNSLTLSYDDKNKRFFLRGHTAKKDRAFKGLLNSLTRRPELLDLISPVLFRYILQREIPKYLIEKDFDLSWEDEKFDANIERLVLLYYADTLYLHRAVDPRLYEGIISSSVAKVFSSVLKDTVVRARQAYLPTRSIDSKYLVVVAEEVGKKIKSKISYSLELHPKVFDARTKQGYVSLLAKATVEDFKDLTEGILAGRSLQQTLLDILERSKS